MWWTWCRTWSIRWERRATGKAREFSLGLAPAELLHTGCSMSLTRSDAHAHKHTPNFPRGAWLAPSSAADREGSVKAWQAVAAHCPTQAPPKP